MILKEEEPILRSLLFVPGHILKFYSSALNSDTDCIVFDVEDSVPNNKKSAAVRNIKKEIAKINSNKILLVRSNSSKTKNFESEIKSTFDQKLYGYVIPKIENEKEIHYIDKLFASLEKKNKIKKRMKIFPLIETPLSVINSNKIALSSKRISGLIFGHEDFLLNIKAPYIKNEENLLFAKSKIVLAARAAKCLPIDTPYLNISNKSGCKKKSMESRGLGFSGMLVLHPSQVKIINKSFSPTKNDILYAKKIINLYKKNIKNQRAISFTGGRFVGPPIIKKAKQVLSYENKLFKIKNL